MSIVYELNCWLERRNVIVIGKQINHYKIPLPRPTKFFRFWFAFTLCFIMWEQGRRKEFPCELHRFIPARPCSDELGRGVHSADLYPRLHAGVRESRCMNIPLRHLIGRFHLLNKHTKIYRTIWLIIFLLQQCWVLTGTFFSLPM